MDLKFDCNRLNKDELAYELKIRGFDEVGNVEEMRSCLRNVMKLERSNQSLTYPAYNLVFDDEIKIVEGKIVEIFDLIENFNDGIESGAYKKITSKIAHIVKRIDRTNPTEPEKHKIRSRVLSQALTMMPKLKNRLRVLQKETVSLLDASLMNIELDDASSLSEGEREIENVVKSSTPKQNYSPASNSHFKSIPVNKWGLQFSGDVKDLSISAFLERVEELSCSRHVDKNELFKSAIDLFKGNALTWFRANRKKFSSWKDISAALKKQFQPHDYDDRLFEEIKRRTQGEGENIGIYVACMSNLFSRLSVTIPEHTQLKLILKNLSPFFQLHLGLTEVHSIDELVQLCNKLETKRHNVESYVKPHKKKNDLEPDLAYLEPSTSLARPVAKISSLSCWNCNKTGHRSKDCKSPKKLHCFKCGCPGVTVKNCQKCSPPRSKAENY